MKSRNWLAAAGILYVVVWVIGLLIASGSPGTSASTAELTTHFLAHRSAHLIRSYLIDGIAGVAVLIFAGALANVFRSFDDSQNAILTSVLWGAGVAAASISLVQAGLQEVLVNPDVLAAGDGSIRTILVLINTTDTFKLLALALFSGAASALILRTHALPRWLGWLGAILSLALFIGGLSFLLESPALLSVLFASLPLLLVWVGAVSVAILQRTEQSAYTVPA